MTSGRYRSDKAELDHRSVCRKTGVSPEVEMDVVTGVELEYSYGARDGQTRSRVASMPKERSGRPRLDWSFNWEKYGYDTKGGYTLYQYVHCIPNHSKDEQEEKSQIYDNRGLCQFPL